MGGQALNFGLSHHLLVFANAKLVLDSRRVQARSVVHSLNFILIK